MMPSIRRRSLLLASPLALLGAQKHSFEFNRSYPTTAKTLDIEIPNGSVELRLTNTASVTIQASIELTAPTPEDLELGKREVRFEPRQTDDTFQIWVELPQNNHRWNRYSTRHNVVIEAPVAMRPLVRAANGPLTISYTGTPTRDLFARGVNGDLQVAFPSAPNADFEMRNVNGQLYSAWEMAPVATPAETVVTERGMKRIVSRNRYTGGRIGRGGIRIQLETTNGDIRIVERKA